MAAVSITPAVISAFKTPDVVEKGWELPPPMVIPDEPVDNPPVTITPVKPATAPDTKHLTVQCLHHQEMLRIM
jgi:protein TonB